MICPSEKTSLSPIRREFAPGFVNYKKSALDSQLQVIKFASCLPMVLSASSITKTKTPKIKSIIDLKRPGLEAMIHHTGDEHANHYTTYPVILEKHYLINSVYCYGKDSFNCSFFNVVNRRFHNCKIYHFITIYLKLNLRTCSFQCSSQTNKKFKNNASAVI